MVITSCLCKVPWPYPYIYEEGEQLVTLTPDQFQFKIGSKSNDLLRSSIERFHSIVFPSTNPVHPPFLITYTNETE